MTSKITSPTFEPLFQPKTEVWVRTRHVFGMVSEVAVSTNGYQYRVSHVSFPAGVEWFVGRDLERVD